MTRTDTAPQLAGSIARPKRSLRLPVELGPLAILIVLVAALGYARPAFLDQANLLSLLEASAYPGMLAIGMVFVLAMREVDLSVGWIFHLAALLTAFLLAAGVSPWLAALAGVLLGAALGLFNGLLVAALRLPVIAVTLATFAMYRGLAAVAVKLEPSAAAVQSGELAEIVHGKLFGVVPSAVFIVAATAVVMQLVLNRSRFGYRVQAVGSNPQAALYAGIPTGWVRLQVLVLMGIVSGLAGVMWLGAPLTDAEQGSGIVLMAIAAAILGGTSLSGGRGTAIGAVIGILIVQVVLSGLSLFGVDAVWNSFAVGTVLALALALDRVARMLRNRRAERNPETLHA